MNKIGLAVGAVALFAAGATGALVTSGRSVEDVTESEIRAAHKTWGDALVQISTDYGSGGIEPAKATAKGAIDAAYGYNLGPVLFKPTLTEAPRTFRTTAEGALAYFVGQDPNFPDDTGFALKGWTEVRFEDAATHVSGDTALWMGNVHITNADGTVTTVDKTFGYHRDEAGTLRIVLHHSSLPYSD